MVTTSSPGWGRYIIPAGVTSGAIVFVVGKAIEAAPFVSALFLMLILGISVWLMADSRRMVREHAQHTTQVAIAAVSAVRGEVPRPTIIDGESRLISSAPVPHQLPPARITVMRSQSDGRWRPQLARPVPVMETTTGPDETGKYGKLEIPLNYLMRFAALATPNRNEWTGNREMYGQCAEWFVAQGVLTKTKGGGFSWDPEYPVESRREWLERLEKAE